MDERCVYLFLVDSPSLFSIDVRDVPILSAAQASFVERWETMDTMVCSIFSGANRDVCASVDLLRAPVNLKTGAVICSLVSVINPVSTEAVVVVVAAVVVVVGSVVGGWKVVAVLETGLVVAAGPGETMAGHGVSPVKGPGTDLLSAEERGMSVWKIPQVSEAEPGFLEIGDAS